MKILVTQANGSTRLFLLLILAMGGCLWMGGQGIYTALHDQHPTTLGYRELRHGRPTAHWLVLTDCELHLGGSAYMIRRSKSELNDSGRITEAYVPILAPGQTPQERCYAVMATKDSGILSLLEEMRQAKSETAAAQFFERHRRDLLVKRDVSGLVRFGIQEQNGEHAKLAGLRGNLAPDFIILAEGEQPNMGLSAGLLAMGLTIGVGLIFMARGNREPDAAS